MLPIELLASRRFENKNFEEHWTTQISNVWLTFKVDETKRQSNKGANEIFISGAVYGVTFGCMPGHILVFNFHAENGGTFFIVLEAIRLISKKIFRSGGMAPSEWTHSVRAVRDTPVAEYYAPGINTTRRVVYRPPITVSLSLPVLSVSYFKRSLWRCGQLWQYVRMGSLGTLLHRDCNAMGDAANISPRVPSTCAQNAILFTNYTHHSKSPDLCGYWQSITRSVRLQSYK